MIVSPLIIPQKFQVNFMSRMFGLKEKEFFSFRRGTLRLSINIDLIQLNRY